MHHFATIDDTHIILLIENPTTRTWIVTVKVAYSKILVTEEFKLVTGFSQAYNISSIQKSNNEG